MFTKRLELIHAKWDRLGICHDGVVGCALTVIVYIYIYICMQRRLIDCEKKSFFVQMGDLYFTMIGCRCGFMKSKSSSVGKF